MQCSARSAALPDIQRPAQFLRSVTHQQMRWSALALPLHSVFVSDAFKTDNANMSLEKQQETSTTQGTASGSDRSLARVSEQVDAVLRSAGVVAALGYLNARARLRFTGIYRPEPPMLRNIRLFDRENPTLNVSGTVIALVDGYCGITCSTNAPFATANSRDDPRLHAHPARDCMISYAGVPIRLGDDSVWGTLCHHDVRPRIIPPGELSVLEHVMPLFAAWVRKNVGTA